MSDEEDVQETLGSDHEKEKNQKEDEKQEKGDSPPVKTAEITAKKIRKKRKVKKSNPQTSEKPETRKKRETKPPSPRILSKSTFAQIAKELKAKRLAQMAYAAAMAKKRKKNKVLRDEELYTDKDRAAAVNMGTTDIKQSLKMKKKLDKNHGCQIPENAEPATLLALGNNELRNGDLKTALKFINKALELNPDDKNGLVARSKCYLSLGDPQLALKDAETALNSDKTFVRAIYQKAEALYHLGDFEHSLMYYHRGHRLRPELECFRLGVQKAQEAIENTIGTSWSSAVANYHALMQWRGREKHFLFFKQIRTLNHQATTAFSCIIIVILPLGTAKINSRKSESSTVSSAKTESISDEKSKNETDTKRSFNSLSRDKCRRRSKSAAPSVKNSARFIGELFVDRLYLENLLKHPDLICSNQEAAKVIKKQAEEGIIFLKSRQEFWRQQKPNTSSSKTIKKEAVEH